MHRNNSPTRRTVSPNAQNVDTTPHCLQPNGGTRFPGHQSCRCPGLAHRGLLPHHDRPSSLTGSLTGNGDTTGSKRDGGEAVR